MRCCFFQKSFLFKDYFLTAAINLTTRGPSYTCLVFMCLLMLTQRVRLYLPILPHNFVNLLAKSGKLWTVQQLVRKQKFVLVWKKNVSQFFPLNVGALHVDLCIQTVYVKINFDCYVSEPLISNRIFELSHSLLFCSWSELVGGQRLS